MVSAEELMTRLSNCVEEHEILLVTARAEMYTIWCYLSFFVSFLLLSTTVSYKMYKMSLCYDREEREMDRRIRAEQNRAFEESQRLDAEKVSQILSFVSLNWNVHTQSHLSILDVAFFLLRNVCDEKLKKKRNEKKRNVVELKNKNEYKKKYNILFCSFLFFFR